MTEPLQVGQFAIVDHEPVDRGPNAGIFHGRGPADDRAELYIVAEGTTPAGEAFAGHIVSAAGHAWATFDMSLTGSLRRLFDEAARNLRDWNRKSIAQHRVSIGLCCFGRRGQQAVIAQAGPAVAFHYTNGTVQAYYTDEEHGRPIGAGPDSEPQLTRIDFGPGDRLLLISTGALRAVDDEIIGGILSLPADQVLPDLYHRLQELRHLTVVLVTAEEGRGRRAAVEATAAPVDSGDDFVIDATGPQMQPLPKPEPEQDQLRDSSYQPSLFISREKPDPLVEARRMLVDVSARERKTPAMPALAAEIPAPLRRASGENVLARLAAERRAHASLSQAALGHAPGIGHAHSRPARNYGPPPAIASTAGDPLAEARRPKPRRDSFSLGLVRDGSPPRPVPVLEDVPLVDDLAEDIRARAAVTSAVTDAIAMDNAGTINNGGSLVRVRGSMSGRWKGGGSLSRRRTSVSGQLPPTWLIVLVGLGILLSVVGIITVPRLLDSSNANRYAELIDQAQQKLSTVGVIEDPAEKREALTEAQAFLLEARDTQGAGPEVAQLLDQVNGQLATMDAIRNPAAVEVVASLEQFGEKPVTAIRLAVSDDSAYLLDSASSQIIQVGLSGGERKVVFGEDKDKHQGRPVAMAFLASNDLGAPSLLIVDTSRNLWAYSPSQGLRPVSFNPPQQLQATDIAVLNRDLYVLDASASVVWKFTPGTDGYTIAPTKALETPDLAAARRLMVDSEIITADANGTVRRFVGQLSLTFSQSGIDKKLAAPDLAQPLSKDGDLAVLDAPNDRIVVFRRDGTFDHQFQHKDFQAMSAFALKDGVGYVFSGGKLRKVTF